MRKLFLFKRLHSVFFPKQSEKILHLERKVVNLMNGQQSTRKMLDDARVQVRDKNKEIHNLTHEVESLKCEIGDPPVTLQQYKDLSDYWEALYKEASAAYAKLESELADVRNILAVEKRQHANTREEYEKLKAVHKFTENSYAQAAQGESQALAKLKECRRIMRKNGIGDQYPGCNVRAEQSKIFDKEGRAIETEGRKFVRLEREGGLAAIASECFGGGLPKGVAFATAEREDTIEGSLIKEGDVKTHISGEGVAKEMLDLAANNAIIGIDYDPAATHGSIATITELDAKTGQTKMYQLVNGEKVELGVTLDDQLIDSLAQEGSLHSEVAATYVNPEEAKFMASIGNLSDAVALNETITKEIEEQNRQASESTLTEEDIPDGEILEERTG